VGPVRRSAARGGRGPGSAVDVAAGSGLVDDNRVRRHAGRFGLVECIAADERKRVGSGNSAVERRHSRRVLAGRCPRADGCSRDDRTEAGQGDAGASRTGGVFKPPRSLEGDPGCESARGLEVDPGAGTRRGGQSAFGSRTGSGRSPGDRIPHAARRSPSARATFGRAVLAGLAERAAGDRDSARVTVLADPDVAGHHHDRRHDRRDPAGSVDCADLPRRAGRAPGRGAFAEPGADRSAALFGSGRAARRPGAARTATRTIAIHPTTRYVNVTGGEIVRFTVGDKSFAWNFSGRPSSFDLSAVAPPGMLDRKVTAYVAPNPLYRMR
jgi:hypothetical protein